MKHRLYALLAGEPSGDLHAAALVPWIRERDPDAEFIGIGGQHLRGAGVELVADTSSWGTIGPFEVFSKLPRIAVAYAKLKSELRKRRPDVTVMLDSPALFMRLAKFTRAQNLSTVYYFPPSAWSDNVRRAQSIAARVDEVVCAFQRQHQTYEKAGVRSHYFGHPIVDVVRRWTRSEALESLGLSEGRYVALMPGSRMQEVRLMTPVFLETVRRLREELPELVFLLPAATEQVYEKLQTVLEETDVILYRGRVQEMLAVSEVALMTSGSVTLEATYFDCPIVLGYKVSAMDAFLGRLLVKLGLLHIPRFSLPNLLLNDDAILELFQEEVHPARLTEEAKKLLAGRPEREVMLSHLQRARECLGAPPVVSQVADLVWNLARRGSQ